MLNPPDRDAIFPSSVPTGNGLGIDVLAAVAMPVADGELPTHAVLYPDHISDDRFHTGLLVTQGEVAGVEPDLVDGAYGMTYADALVDLADRVDTAGRRLRANDYARAVNPRPEARQA